ncbi:hypothetical protein LRY60_03415 [Candidatus Woesebacteria bacterium]|nr:hypothetical protein [Candidatus Woesebacteria bacterium]MCD8506886.1 hypothetical protein [Candidatus Woesebacteria bacterium]
MSQTTGHRIPQVWLPEYPSDTGRHRDHELTPITSLNEVEKERVDGWWGTNGLLVHLVGVTNLYEGLVSLIKEDLPNHPNMSPRFRNTISNINTGDGIISLWGHDIGRLVTHHRVLHAVVSQIMLKMIGFSGLEMQDHELSIKHGFANSNIEEGFHPDHMALILREMPIDELIWYGADMVSKLRPNGTIRRPRTFYRAMKESEWKYVKADDMATKHNYIRQALFAAVLGNALTADSGLRLTPEQADAPFVRAELTMHRFLHKLQSTRPTR